VIVFRSWEISGLPAARSGIGSAWPGLKPYSAR
jgi:hypothetical protein